MSANITHLSDFTHMSTNISHLSGNTNISGDFQTSQFQTSQCTEMSVIFAFFITSDDLMDPPSQSEAEVKIEARFI